MYKPFFYFFYSIFFLKKTALYAINHKLTQFYSVPLTQFHSVPLSPTHSVPLTQSIHSVPSLSLMDSHQIKIFETNILCIYDRIFDKKN